MKERFLQIFELLKKLNYILNKKQKKKALFMLVIILTLSGLELIGVSFVLPFIQAVIAPDVLMKNHIIQSIMEWFNIKSENGLLILVGVTLIAFYLIKNAYMILAYYVRANYSTRIQKELSLKMLNSYMKRPYTFFLDTNTAEVIRGCSVDVSGVYNIVFHLFTIASEGLSIFLIGMFIFITDPFIALGVIVIMLLVLLGIVTVLKPLLKRLGKDILVASTKQSKAIYQSIAGIKEILVLKRMHLFEKEYEKASDLVRKIQCTYTTLQSVPDRLAEGICVGGIIGIVVIRLSYIGPDNMDYIPKLGVFAMAAFRVFPSVGKLAAAINGIVYNLPGLNNVYHNMLEVVSYEKEQKRYIELHGEHSLNTSYNRKLEFKNEIQIKGVSWQYNKAKKPVLTNVCMSIHKGEAVGLIGASGAGKTTLADVILGLLHPQYGVVNMDGIDIYTIPDEWAQIVGYVPQAVFLIDDTVRNNISFGLPNEEVRDEDIWEALERAQLAPFIRTLPEGLETVVGERGVKFSGGQRQRIAIARALYHKPEILILDEATAALDNETETAVMESIDALQGQVTMIIVAHRLTTIRNCDKIYEIKEGIAVERTKEEVLN